MNLVFIKGGIEMKEILKQLIKSWKAILFIIIFLAIQAICDLSLPDYTSRIINIGVQQGGIENVVPEAISASTLEELSLLLSKEDWKTVESFYQPISKNQLSKKEYQAYKKKYTTLEKQKIYVRKKISKEEQKKLNQILEKPMLIHSFLTSDGKQAVTMQNKIKEKISDTYQNLSMIEVLKLLPEEQKLEMQKNISKAFENMPDSIISQGSIAAVKEEYIKLGMETDHIQTNYILLSGLKMLGIALISMISTIIVGFLGARTAAKLAKNLRNIVYEKVLSFSTTEFKNFGVASLITRTTNDIQQIQMLIVFTLRIIIYAPIIGFGGVFKVLHTNTSMTWIIALAVGIILSMMIFLFVMVMPKFKLVQKLIDRLNLVTREILNGIPVIRAFSNQNHEEARFEKANKDLKKTTLFVDRIMSLLMPTMTFVMNAICILIVWKGAHSIESGIMQVGDMLALIQYTMQIIMSFLMVSMFSIMMPRASVSIGRVAELLRTKSVIIEPKNPKTFSKRIKGLVEFKNVSFQYPDSDEDVLTDITFTANPGETTAFIGSTGSGKSTLINLIPRLFDVTKGEILIDGINVKDVPTETLHKKIGFAPQKGVLFSGTIASNLRYGKKDASDEEIAKAAKIAQAEEFIESKKEKYESPISQGGTNVSGGQKQRLSIARAIACDPEIYIFDDSFSALDFKTDAALRKSLRKETKDATVLIVAQRISTIMNADQIIVLNEGKIVGKGTHKELLKKCSVYKEIASSQLSKEELGNA